VKMNFSDGSLDTDLLQAQSILYRRLSANLYETKNPGEYFHLHGSLEATKALNMVGLQGHCPNLTDYHEIIRTIEGHVKQFTADELEDMNASIKQAGVTCMKWEDFQATEHGRKLIQQPPWKVETLETESPPVPFLHTPSRSPKPQILSGIRVLELCRIIAGPGELIHFAFVEDHLLTAVQPSVVAWPNMVRRSSKSRPRIFPTYLSSKSTVI
jgi:hypothetical protein